jgi:hypothetical protein
MHAGPADGGGSGGVKKVKSCKKVTPAEGAAAAAQPEQEAADAEMAAFDGESTGARMNGLHAEEPDVCLSCVVASPVVLCQSMLSCPKRLTQVRTHQLVYPARSGSLSWPVVALLAFSAMLLQLPPHVGALLYVLVSVHAEHLSLHTCRHMLFLFSAMLPEDWFTVRNTWQLTNSLPLGCCCGTPVCSHVCRARHRRWDWGGEEGDQGPQEGPTCRGRCSASARQCSC